MGYMSTRHGRPDDSLDDSPWIGENAGIAKGFETMGELFRQNPCLGAILFLVFGFALGMLIKLFTGELSSALAKERSLEAYRHRAARAIRRMEKANRKIDRAHRKAEMAERDGNPWQLASANRDVKRAIPGARYAYGHIRAVLRKAHGLPFSKEMLQEVIEREAALRDTLAFASELLKSFDAVAKTLTPTRKLEFAQGRKAHDVEALLEAAQAALRGSEALIDQAKAVLQTAVDELSRFEAEFRQKAGRTVCASGGLLRNPFRSWTETEADDAITAADLLESKRDLQRIASALALVEASLVRAQDAVVSIGVLNAQHIVMRGVLNQLELALDRLDSAIGDADNPLPRELAARHSAIFGPIGDEAAAGVLERLQQELEVLENSLYSLLLFYHNRNSPALSV